MNPLVVIFSSSHEWRAARAFYPDALLSLDLYGEWFELTLAGRRLIMMHGGWGKVPAAASAEYAISRWKADGLINLGTCGGFSGQIERGEIILVERTVIYDIFEQIADPEAALRHFSTQLDLAWLQQPYPQPVRRTLMVSADRDIIAADIPMLVERYGALAGDWESGAIAWVAARHGLPCLILRGVSDLVGAEGGEAYGSPEVFQAGARQVIGAFVEHLAEWVEKFP
jgi:adenosylhomocysteine nucleosidase